MNDRFIIQISQNHPSGWVCTDTKNGIVCVFENGKFNDTQKFTLLEDVNMLDSNALAIIAREMGDWLFSNHYDKIF